MNRNKEQSEAKTKEPNWLDAIGIVGQDLDAYTAWITQVDSGAPAATTGRASDKKTAFSLQNDLRLVGIDLQALLSTAKKTINQSDKDKKDEATKKALNEMALKMQPKNTIDSSGSSYIQTGPFMTAFASDLTCGPYIYLYSKGKERERKSTDTGTSSCPKYLSDTFKELPDIDIDVGLSIDKIMAEATQTSNDQLSQVNESNPDLVLSKVDNKSKNRRSARDFLESAEAYLKNLLEDDKSIAKNKTQKDLIVKTKNQISSSLEIINKQFESNASGKSGEPIPADPEKKIADLYKELIPQGDTSAVAKALNEIINQDIDHRISLGQTDENLAILMQLSSKDSLTELIQNYIGLESVRTQTRSAKELTKTNLTALGSIFSQNLEDRMKTLKKDNSPDANDTLALLCMQSLAVPDSPKMGKINVSEYCAGKNYKSVYEKSGIQMDYDALSAKDYPERACAVYDFYRKSYLYGLKTRDSSRRQEKGVK